MSVLPVDQGNHWPRLFERRANVGASLIRESMAELELQSILLGGSCRRAIIPLHISLSLGLLLHLPQFNHRTRPEEGVPEVWRAYFPTRFLVVLLLPSLLSYVSAIATFSSPTLNALLKFTVTFSANRFSYSTKIKLQNFSRASRFPFWRLPANSYQLLNEWIVDAMIRC